MQPPLRDRVKANFKKSIKQFTITGAVLWFIREVFKQQLFDWASKQLDQEKEGPHNADRSSSARVCGRTSCSGSVLWVGLLLHERCVVGHAACTAKTKRRTSPGEQSKQGCADKVGRSPNLPDHPTKRTQIRAFLGADRAPLVIREQFDSGWNLSITNNGSSAVLI